MGNAGEKENAPHNVRCANWERQLAAGGLKGEAVELLDYCFPCHKRVLYLTGFHFSFHFSSQVFLQYFPFKGKISPIIIFIKLGRKDSDCISVIDYFADEVFKYHLPDIWVI